MTHKNVKEDMVFGTIKGFAGLDRNLAWEISRYLVDIGMIRDPIESPEESALGELEMRVEKALNLLKTIKVDDGMGIVREFSIRQRLTRIEQLLKGA